MFQKKRSERGWKEQEDEFRGYLIEFEILDFAILNSDQSQDDQCVKVDKMNLEENN